MIFAPGSDWRGAVVHCKNAQRAKYVLTAIAKRLTQCKLELHPEKTRIVYCKDGKRNGSYERERFDFLIVETGQWSGSN
jgi:hypothetical protein